MARPQRRAGGERHRHQRRNGAGQPAVGRNGFVAAPAGRRQGTQRDGCDRAVRQCATTWQQLAGHLGYPAPVGGPRHRLDLAAAGTFRPAGQQLDAVADLPGCRWRWLAVRQRQLARQRRGNTGRCLAADPAAAVAAARGQPRNVAAWCHRPRWPRASGGQSLAGQPGRDLQRRRPAPGHGLAPRTGQLQDAGAEYRVRSAARAGKTGFGPERQWSRRCANHHRLGQLRATGRRPAHQHLADLLAGTVLARPGAPTGQDRRAHHLGRHPRRTAAGWPGVADRIPRRNAGHGYHPGRWQPEPGGLARWQCTPGRFGALGRRQHRRTGLAGLARYRFAPAADREG